MLSGLGFGAAAAGLVGGRCPLINNALVERRVCRGVFGKVEVDEGWMLKMDAWRDRGGTSEGKCPRT